MASSGMLDNKEACFIEFGAGKGISIKVGIVYIVRSVDIQQPNFLGTSRQQWQR